MLMHSCQLIIMSITTLEKPLPLLDSTYLSEFDTLLINKLTLSLFDYAKIKRHQKTENVQLNPANIVQFHDYEKFSYKFAFFEENHREKMGLLKEFFPQEPFKCPTLKESFTCTNKNKSSNANLATSIAAELHKM